MMSCTESKILHNVKLLKDRGAKSYGEKVFKNMIAIKIEKENVINLIGFYLNKINKKPQKQHSYFLLKIGNYNTKIIIYFLFDKFTFNYW